MPKLLVPAAGQTAAAETADYAMQVAKALNAEVVPLHVVRPGHSKEAGELALEYFQKSCEESDVPLQCEFREGLIVDQIIDFAEENDVDLIVIGASRGTIVDKWLSLDVRDNTMVPVLVIPYQMFD
ncbi:MAG: universal stress protein [Planctomycetota bacterium]